MAGRQPLIVVIYCLALNGQVLHDALDNQIPRDPYGEVGVMKCKVIPWVNIGYNGPNGLTCASDCMGLPPGAFDVSPDSTVFVLYSWTLHRYTAKGVLESKSKVSRRSCDFKYFGGDLYVFQGDSLSVFDSKSLDLIRTVNLTTPTFRPSPVLNLSYFLGTALLFRELNAMGVPEVVGAFDLRHMTQIGPSGADSLLPIWRGESGASIDTLFLQRLFQAKSTVHFLAASGMYIVYYYACNAKVRKGECQRDILNFYAIAKKNGRVYACDINKNRMSAGNITLATSRPMVFIDDTTAVVQSALVDNSGSRRVLYSFATFREN